MQTIYDIIEELNLENGTKYKESVLIKHRENELFKKVLRMTYDKVMFSYGITMKNIVFEYESNYLEEDKEFNLEYVLNDLEKNFCSRELTGHDAINRLTLLLETSKKEDALIIEKIIGRDLKLNIGKTIINKVFKGLITDPCYMRCDIFSNDKIKNGKLVKGTSNNIDFDAYLQIKADGTYREFKVENEIVTCNSRSGEDYEYETLFASLRNFINGHYMGELTVFADDSIMARILPAIEKEDLKNDTHLAEELINKYNEHKLKGELFILPRQIGNGLINSDDVPHDNIILELWDYVTLEEYKLAALKDKKNLCKTKYKDRFEKLISILKENNNSNIKVIPYVIVKNLKEAMEQTSKWMKDGFEGSILKDYSGLFKDGTSKHQLKLKIAFTIDVRIVGFIEGTKGTKREETFGSLVYETDDKMIQGSVSGFNDEQLKEINNNREKYMDTVMEIEGNDLTQGRGNNYYAVSHPRFIEHRFDKNTTDDLERALESLELAKMFKERD